jgi:hypothetical protein
MRPVTPEFLQAIQQPHEVVVVVEVWVDGAWLALPVTDGSISVDLNSPGMRSLRLTVAPGAGSIAGQRIDSIELGLFGTYIRAWRGVGFADGSIELVPLGVFAVDSLQRKQSSGGVAVSLVGVDLFELVVRARLLVPATYGDSGNRIEVVKQLIREALEPNLPWGAVQFDVKPGVPVVPMLPTVIERDRGDVISDLLQAIGCIGYFDPAGVYTVRPRPESDTAPVVWDASQGDLGVTLALDQALSRKGTYNAVVAIGESNDREVPPVYGVAKDTDPASPTFWDGPFGKNPRFYASQFLYTVAQCEATARSLLATSRFTQKSLNLSTIPNPALEPGDRIRIWYGPSGPYEDHVLSTLEMPLSVRSAMRGTSRMVGESDAGETRRGRAAWQTI